ncbi:MAG: substrate-binding domain-containing protein, partial [Chloroflexi bacterium]|nr:substrate-binding domain-containing protein [Chloroflexota bacterium]
MKRIISRRQLLKAAAIGGTGAVLAACAPATPQIVEVTRETVKEVEKQVEVTTEVEVTKEVQVTAAPEQVPQTLTVWGSGLDLTQIEKDPAGAGAALIKHRDTFLANHANATVVWEDHGWDEELRQNIVSALLAGTQPDVIVGENFFQQYAALKALLPLDDVITPEVKENSIEGTHKAAIYDGKVYGLSWFSGCFGFEVNPNVLKDAGLAEQVPATWDELIEASKAVTEKSGGASYGYTLQGPVGFSVGGMFRLAVYMQQVGVTLNKPEQFDYPNFNDPNGVQVWEFVRKILPYTPPGLVFEPDEGKVYTQLFAGKSAHQMAGSWHVAWAKSNELANAIYGQVPIPQGGKPASYVVGNVIYGAMAATKVPELAKDWIIAGQNKELQDIILKSTTRLPSTKSGVETVLADSSVEDATKQFAKLLRDSDLGILPQWTKEP